jgi:hypothetical protein
MSKRGRGGAVGAKFRMSLALPVGAVMNCADNTGSPLPCFSPICPVFRIRTRAGFVADRRYRHHTIVLSFTSFAVRASVVDPGSGVSISSKSVYGSGSIVLMAKN